MIHLIDPVVKDYLLHNARWRSPVGKKILLSIVLVVAVLDVLAQQSTRLGLWGLSEHIVWSAFVGMGIGFAAESTQRGWRKWKRFVLFYLIAAVMHSAFDSGLLVLGLLVVAVIQSFP